MKRNLKFAALSAAVLMTGFSSCSSEDEANDQIIQGETKTVILKLDTQTPSTYAEEATMTSGKATLNDCYIYFVESGTGVIHKTVTVSSTDLGDYTRAAGNEIPSVPAAANTVVVVGNVPSSMTSVLSAPSSMTTVTGATVSIFEQLSNSIILEGSASMTLVSGDEYTASVAVKPIVSRFEIGSIKAVGSAGATDIIEEYNVTGIFINNTYKNMSLGGTVTTSSLLYSTILTDFNKTNYPNPLSDLTVSPAFLGSEAKTEPTKIPNTGVWAYNFLPVDSNATTPLELPQIVLKLEDIKLVETGTTLVSGAKLVTVKSFRDVSNTVLKKFERNKIYKIEKIEFNETHLDITPTAARNVTVIVSVKDWETVTVTPEI